MEEWIGKRVRVQLVIKGYKSAAEFEGKLVAVSAIDFKLTDCREVGIGHNPGDQVINRSSSAFVRMEPIN
jgi:hypothetical protein